ncbi:PBP1A family penicillin-binding protein [Rickettsiales bacterium]|nr:PBP1A family penicillin-binding protein [Rickettsiales bacterium]
MRFKFFTILFKLFIIASIWLGGAIAIYLFYKYHNLPNIDDINLTTKDKILQINYSDGSKIKTIGDIYSNQVTFNQFPDHLLDALIATEDRNFFSHHGFDLKAIIRAFFVNYNSGKIKQGASTITQQLARVLFLNNKKTYSRKINEILLAYKLEQIFNKEQILTLYFNHVYFGSGNYGIKDAAKFYFNKKVKDLNLNESAILVGILKAPSKLSPNNNKKLANQRADIVLQNMIHNGNIGLDSIKYFDDKINYQKDNLQELYFADYVAANYQNFLNKKETRKKFFKIQTTLDKRLQNLTELSISKLYKKYPQRLQNSQIATITMSYDGKILSMIGGKNYQQSQYNRATQSKRQIGSIAKTFIYLTAFQNGFTPFDNFEDKKITISGWSPKNYNNKYYGNVTLIESFAKSLNSVAIQLAQKVNIEKIIDNMKIMNIESKINQDLTIALGTSQLTLLELVTSFAIIANGGNYIIPSFIKRIESGSGNNIYQRKYSNIGKIYNQKEINMIKLLLRSVITDGTGNKANIADDIYGKTGTSQNFRDAYFIGFNSNYVIAIWIGNDNNKSTNQITGGMLPAILFKDLITSFQK